MKYRADINGLRAISVLGVIFFHADFTWMMGGYLGVDVFFVISGFLISQLLNEGIRRGGFQFRSFYTRRVRRIFPALLIMVACIIPFAYFILIPSDLVNFSWALISIIFLVPNIFFLKNTGYFEAGVEYNPLIHTWTLGVEEQFYLFFPFLIFFANKYQRKLMPLIIFLIIFSLAIVVIPFFGGGNSKFYLLPSRAWEFLFGAASALVLSKYSSTINRQILLKEIGSFLGLGLIILSFLSFNRHVPNPSVYSLIPVLGVSLILIFGDTPTVIGRILALKPIVFIGLISYSSYLWHQPIFAFARYISFDDLTSLDYVILILVTLATSFFSWKCIEQPFRKSSFYSSKVMGKLLLFMVVSILAFALISINFKGYPHRYDQNVQELVTFQNRDMGKYVESAFNRKKLIDFDSNDQRKKVFLIGDSYAQDLFNAVEESSLKEYYQLSTYSNNPACGGLYIEHDAIKNDIPYYLRHSCSKQNFFLDKNIISLILSSDEIWLANRWNELQLKLILESIANIKAVHDIPIIVFGSKDFGVVPIRQFSTLSAHARCDFESSPKREVLKLNQILKSSLSNAKYVDVQSIFCGVGHDLCRNFTADKCELISYDGHHLTRVGARLLGDQLSNRNLLKN